MNDFFSGEMTNPIPWFGLTHFLILFGFTASIALLWYISPKLKNSKYEIYVRYFLLFLILIFEWQVFENRIFNESVFRMPLCALSLYGLTFAVMFKNEKVFKIVYFYAFGTFLTFLFFDTQWGLDRWDGWKFFGAHATIAWLAVYGINVHGYQIKKIDFRNSIIALAIYSAFAIYASAKLGGSDELFFLHPAIPELQSLIDIHLLVYLIPYCLTALLLMFLMYIPTQFKLRNK